MPSFPAAVADANTRPSAWELSTLFHNNDTVVELNNAFVDDTTSSAHLAHYAFMSRSILRLQAEIDRQQEEMTLLYDHIIDDDCFRTGLQPVLYEHRCRVRARGFSPFTLQPLGHRRSSTPHPHPH